MTNVIIVFILAYICDSNSGGEKTFRGPSDFLLIFSDLFNESVYPKMNDSFMNQIGLVFELNSLAKLRRR